MGGRFGIGLRFKAAPAGLKLVPKVLEVFDDAVVDQRYLKRCVRVGVAGGGRAVRRPAGMCDSDPSGQRIGGKRLRQIIELSFGAPPFDMPVDDGRDARRVIAAIFQPPQPFDQPVGYLVLAQNADDAAHDYSVRSEEHTSELQSLMRISYAVFCLKKKTNTFKTLKPNHHPHKLKQHLT